MASRLEPRGPDGQGSYYGNQGAVGLIHRRLAIIDLSESGAQPMQSANERYTITFNGEIYNYRELKAKLEGRGYTFRSNSDTEVLLTLYQEVGPAMCSQLRGMFAFAIWDDKEQTLFLARDQFGIKPLYYTYQRGHFVFASQAKTLRLRRDLSFSLNPVAQVAFFLWGHTPEGETVFKECRELHAGHHMTVTSSGPGDQVCYWSVRESILENFGSDPAKSQEERRERVRELMLDSVRAHFVSDVPVGLFLSAGRDSAALLGLSAEINETPPRSLTMAFGEYVGTADDELPLAELIARHYGSPHESQLVDQRAFVNDIDLLFDAMDRMTIDGINTYQVSKLAAKCNMKVVLSGLGGDELFGGYPSFHQIPELRKRVAKLSAPDWVGRWTTAVSKAWVPLFASPKYSGIVEYGGSVEGAYMLRRGLFMPWELPQVVGPELARDGLRELDPLGRLRKQTEGIDDEYLKVMALEMTQYMMPRLLRDSDWASMAHSIELRVPFVDVPLFEGVLAMSSENNFPTKADMAASPSKPLPTEVTNRPKTGFQVPVQNWLLHASPTSKREASLRAWSRIVYNHFVLGRV